MITVGRFLDCLYGTEDIIVVSWKVSATYFCFEFNFYLLTMLLAQKILLNYKQKLREQQIKNFRK